MLEIYYYIHVAEFDRSVRCGRCGVKINKGIDCQTSESFLQQIFYRTDVNVYSGLVSLYVDIVKRQRVQTPNKSISIWLMCMMIEASGKVFSRTLRWARFLKR